MWSCNGSCREISGVVVECVLAVSSWACPRRRQDCVSGGVLDRLIHEIANHKVLAQHYAAASIVH